MVGVGEDRSGQGRTEIGWDKSGDRTGIDRIGVG